MMMRSLSRISMSGMSDRRDVHLLTNERYFRALVKPKKGEVQANEAESSSTSSSSNHARSLIADGSVFSSLPLYRVRKFFI